MKSLGWILFAVFVLTPAFIVLWWIIKGKKSATPSPTATPAVASGNSTSKWWSWAWKHITLKGVSAFTIGIVITLTVREFWREGWDKFSTDHGWYFWLVLVAGNLLFCLLFGRGAKSPAGGTTASAGGHPQTDDTGGLATFGRIVIGFIVLFTAIHFIKVLFPGVWQDNQRSYGQTVAQPTGQLDPEGSWVRKMAGTNGWTHIQVGKNLKMRCVPDHPTAHIWIRFNNESPIEDWRDQELFPAPLETPYDFYFKSAGTNEVPVKIYLTQ